VPQGSRKTSAKHFGGRKKAEGDCRGGGGGGGGGGGLDLDHLTMSSKKKERAVSGRRLGTQPTSGIASQTTRKKITRLRKEEYIKAPLGSYGR